LIASSSWSHCRLINFITDAKKVDTTSFVVYIDYHLHYYDKSREPEVSGKLIDKISFVSCVSMANFLPDECFTHRRNFDNKTVSLLYLLAKARMGQFVLLRFTALHNIKYFAFRLICFFPNIQTRSKDKFTLSL